MGAPSPYTDSARGSSNSSGNPRNAGSGWGLWQAVVVLRIAGGLRVGWSSYMYSLTIRCISIYQIYTPYHSIAKYTYIHWFTIDDGRCTYTGINRTHTVGNTLSHMAYIYIYKCLIYSYTSSHMDIIPTESCTYNMASTVTHSSSPTAGASRLVRISL